MMDSFVNASNNFSIPYEVTEDISFALKLTRFLSDRILVPIIVCLGVAGNSCNIVVLSRPKMRTSTNVYLTNLAIFDMLYLIFMLTLSFIHCRDKDLDASNYYYVPYGRALSNLFGNCSVWVTVCFTLERYIGVCHPMKGKAWCTVQKAKLLTFVLFVFCFINTLPVTFEYEVVKENQLDTNVNNNLTINKHAQSNEMNNTVSHYRCQTSELSQRNSYQFGYNWWYIIIFTILPLILLSVFNTILIKSVWHANSRRKLLSQCHVIGDHSAQSIEQQKVTTMLISVVIIFLICQFPWAILLVYKVYLSTLSSDRNEDYIRIAGNVCNLLGQVNASVNFILYSYFSCRFRKTFRELFCKWKGKKRTRNNLIILEFPARKSDFSKESFTTSLMGYRYRRSLRQSEPHLSPIHTNCPEK